MEKTFTLDTISAFNNFNDVETKHPLVSLIKWLPTTLKPDCRLHMGLYGIDLTLLGNQEGKLSIMFPGGHMEQRIESDVSMKHILVFHPDLIQGTSLADIIKEWNFLGNSTAISLHLSPEECQLISAFFDSIESELVCAKDKHSKKLIVSHIERTLNYCLRFFDSQAQMPGDGSKKIIKGFDRLLNDYFVSGNIYEIGVPTVAYFAEQLHHSANYFGDLIKRETGKSAQEYIRDRLIEEAKSRMRHLDKSITEIAFELGFKYPQHFSRFFKQLTDKTPLEFRQELQKTDME